MTVFGKEKAMIRGEWRCGNSSTDLSLGMHYFLLFFGLEMMLI